MRPAPAVRLGRYADLSGRVVVVTGGSRGIGAAAGLALAEQGTRVVLVGRDAHALQASVSRLWSAGADALGVQADCTDPQQLKRLQEATEARFGPPDGLLAFAGGGTSRPQPLQDIALNDWRSSVENNLDATFLTVQALLPGMLARGRGSIVTMASAGARVVAGAPAAYAAAKAGVIALTRHLAQELGPQGLRVNCISPSAVLTERMQATLPVERREQMLQGFPLGRLGTPEDVAAAALFLLSDASAWISGTVLDVAGGRVMV